MIKTIWVDAYFKQLGKWEDYEEPTGETKKGFFGTKEVTIKKQRWILLNKFSDSIIDGAKLADDISKQLNNLESENFEILNITPVISGHYNWSGYSKSGPQSSSADTCASWGYSVTEGVMICARKK